MKNMLINCMRARRDWVEFKAPLEMGRPLSADLSTHIFLFKLVAMYMGCQAEWKMTKDLFVGSLRCLNPSSVKDARGKYLPFGDIVKAAQEAKQQFALMNAAYGVGQSKEEGAAAAAAWKRERETMRMKRRRPETNVIEMNMEGEEESVRGEETGLEAEVKAERGAQPEDLHAGDAGKLGTSQGSV